MKKTGGRKSRDTLPLSGNIGMAGADAGAKIRDKGGAGVGAEKK